MPTTDIPNPAAYAAAVHRHRCPFCSRGDSDCVVGARLAAAAEAEQNQQARCPVCGVDYTPTGPCPNSIHPASRDAHRALALDLPALADPDPRYPNGQCPACGHGLDPDGTCPNEDCEAAR